MATERDTMAGLEPTWPNLDTRFDFHCRPIYVQIDFSLPTAPELLAVDAILQEKTGLWGFLFSGQWFLPINNSKFLTLVSTKYFLIVCKYLA